MQNRMRALSGYNANRSSVEGKLATSTLLRDQFERSKRLSTQLRRNEMDNAQCTIPVAPKNLY